MAVDYNKTRLVSEAGEHLVLSRLLRLGVQAALQPGGWRGGDIMVEGNRTVEVKTTSGPSLAWMLKEPKSTPGRVFALVQFKDRLNPVIYVVPDEVIVKAAAESHAAYLKSHPNSKDSSLRKIRDPWAKGAQPKDLQSGWLAQFFECWELIPPITGQ